MWRRNGRFLRRLSGVDACPEQAFPSRLPITSCRFVRLVRLRTLPGMLLERGITLRQFDGFGEHRYRPAPARFDLHGLSRCPRDEFRQIVVGLPQGIGVQSQDAHRLRRVPHISAGVHRQSRCVAGRMPSTATTGRCRTSACLPSGQKYTVSFTTAAAPARDRSRSPRRAASLPAGSGLGGEPAGRRSTPPLAPRRVSAGL